ncbi:MAG: glycosyl hydrolase 115 family protein [Muribaculaceae bacterium]|nr:glycosyl hydrolase 115 family protein [Muribaculaceae bacterium]
MKKLLSFIFTAFLLALLFPIYSSAATILKLSNPEGFSLQGSPIVYDTADYALVANVAQMLAEDICKVTGKNPDILTSLPKGTNAILIGTLGHSRLIDDLAKKGIIPADSIHGGWERFIIKTIPTKKGKKFLVIAGSDRRGTAYGATTLSREIGVDPWTWWADVPVKQNPEIKINADYISHAPTIKYRGIFINDEDWGILPWAAKGLDSDINDIGPNTYEKVFQLLLRLKGNMLAPAMHSCTGVFYSHPESKVVADRYGIIMTTSHCEPIMFNNAALSEWNPERDGEWDYGTNRDVIYGKFSDRLNEVADYENIYTIGMRGVHDEAMSRTRPVEERIALLEKVITDQRNLLSKRLGKPAEEIPQIFVPYKETLDLYRKGLNVPDDVTIIWPDDNYGYMKSVSSPEERKRSGSSGVYYHTSYLGTPHDYLWLCTTPPAMMYHELKKAYDCGSDRYWLLNVGDIKPAELDTQTFFDMAWDFNSFSQDNINSYQSSLVAEWCGEKYKLPVQEILDEYYRLAWIRKPEYMGWEIEWDSPDTREVGPTDFSFSNYGDAWQRLDEYKSLAAKTEALMQELPDSLRTPFFEMIGYPVLASEMMNRKFLFAQLNGELSDADDLPGANYAARLSVEAADSIDTLNKIYNSLENGKWNGMMTVPPGFCAKYQERPPLRQFPEAGEKPIVRAVDWQSRGDGLCRTLDLRTAKLSDGASFIDGIGYDGYILQLGDPVSNSNEAEAIMHIDDLQGDSITLQIFHLPYFPMYEGKGCRIGVTFDDGEEQIIEYLPEEWSMPWKINVLRNSALSEVSCSVDKEKSSHIIKLRGIDSGMAIQRIVVDGGSFRPGYLGPSPKDRP